MISEARRSVSGSWLREGTVALARSVALVVLMLAGLGLLLFGAGVLAAPVSVAVVLMQGNGWRPHLPVAVAVAAAGLLIWLALAPLVLLAIRQLATWIRSLSVAWFGAPIAEPYQPVPPRADIRGRLRWLLGDRATWRDLLWVVANTCVGWVLLLVPAILTGVGLIAFIGSRVIGSIPPPAYPGNSTPSILIVGTAFTAFGFWLAPRSLRGYGKMAAALLGPAGDAELAVRVRHLSRTRSEAIDAGAAEVRRIERDLHDGAQARLVAMGMTLDAAGQLIHENPQAAQALLIEARDNSIKALKELRDLVRGVHPPVLADRGLADAIKALALDTPLRIHVASDLNRARPPAPVESAAYFAVSELITNVVKHAKSAQAWIDIRYTDGMLRIGVTDDGHGGADLSRGSGLNGIERRIAAFDGVLAISSPPGGPTAVTLEIPCAVSG